MKVNNGDKRSVTK